MKTNRSLAAPAAFWLFAVACLALSPAPAQSNATAIYRLTYQNGIKPQAGLTEDRNHPGTFYGVAPQGGAYGQGTVFKLSTDGTAAGTHISTVHDFSALDANSDNADGATPYATLVQASDGDFYGTTLSGGASGNGTVFQYDPASGTLTPLHSFSPLDGNADNTEGATPYAALIQASDGSFYGTATRGGAYGNGTVFQMSTDGTSFTTLHSFSALNSSAHNTDGANPYAALIQASDGAFYGTARGGGTSGNGTVFKMSANGTSFATLNSFGTLDGNGDNADGANPYAALVEDQSLPGTFYGTATRGGVYGSGVLFKITAGAFNALYSFAGGINGYSPNAALVQGRDGLFYGTTLFGGTSGTTKNAGTIYQYNPANGSFTVLHSFTGTDGGHPSAALTLGSDGFFYGTTSTYGDSSNGTVFRLTSSGAVISLLSFNGSNGINPDAALVAGSGGSFYGTTFAGGAHGLGTVFKLSPDGSSPTGYSLAALHSFAGGTDGANPYAALVLGSDGFFYGTTYAGGKFGDGVVFKMSASGVVTTLHPFSGGPEGVHPYAALIQASDGAFYGTTFAGGPAHTGTVFKMSASGAVTTLHKFSVLDNSLHNTDGASPYAALVQGSDGNFYGTTSAGGAFGNGTAFKMTTNGTLAGTSVTTLHAFSTLDGNFDNTDGANPYAALVEDKSLPGTFYGTTYAGGASGNGVVFTMTTDGTLAGTSLVTLHPFSGGADGSNPQAPVALIAPASVPGSLKRPTTRGGYRLVGTTYYGGTAAGTVAGRTVAGRKGARSQIASPAPLTGGTAFQQSPDTTQPTNTNIANFTGINGSNPSAQPVAGGTATTTEPPSSAGTTASASFTA